MLTVPLYDRSPEEAFRFLSERGVQAVELGTGGFPGNNHCDPGQLLADPAKLDALASALRRYGLTVSALSCHSNHLHPRPEVRESAARLFTQTCALAQKLGVDTVVTFSGCPGGAPGDTRPNWVACSWPHDYPEILRYQWEQELIPFWKKAAEEALRYGVTKIALEMHPGFCVYNTHTLLRLREAAGPFIGANFDPSHLYWQGIRPSVAIRALKGAIHHFHAKDTKIDEANTSVNGVLDTGSMTSLAERSWLFRTVGYGHGEEEWREIITALRLAGYDGAVSIEHEDAFMSVEEGLDKGIRFLRDMIFTDTPAEAWWV